jgi:tetratricopeptide (TPR) repeat protein
VVWSYWCGWALIAARFAWRTKLRALAARWKLQARIRAAMPGTGSQLNGLTAASLAIKQGHEERALYILENLSIKPDQQDVLLTRRWLAALASTSWMARQRPSRPLAASHHPFPQLQALALSSNSQRMPLRLQALERELSQASSSDLDVLAQDYISLVDVLISSLGRREMPFSGEAEDLLEFTTGRVFILSSRERFTAWWKTLRPVLVRGGGALLIGLRLLQRECYSQAAQLLGGLSRDGMLSSESDTLRRAAAFLTLFGHPHWRMSSSDIPRYFTEGCYHMATDMGVLRFPMAELPEVVACCRRGVFLRESKRALINDTLQLWELFGDEVSQPMALLLKRLLEHKGRQCPPRLPYWKQLWAASEAGFERHIELLMDGIVATAARRLDDAERLFNEVAKLQPGMSLPLVNLVHVLLLKNDRPAARKLAADIEARFPTDGHAFISLGRFLVTDMEDSSEAERLFRLARRLTDPSTEALICLGELKFMEGQYMEAQEFFSDAKQNDPDQPGPKLELARVYMETKRFDLAIENLDAVVRDGHPDARDLAHYLLYRTYREMGEDKRAFESLDKVPPRFFKEPDVLDDIAGHLESEHRYAKAREFAERAMILRAKGGSQTDDSDMLGAF